MAKLFKKVRNLFRKPAPPRVRQHVVGHRGVAVGSSDPAKQDLSAENVAQWTTVPASFVEQFVYEGWTFYVHSTNVDYAQYDIDKQELTIGYKGDGAYVYSNVSEEEAISFATAFSKGSWAWDRLRVRGSKTAHRKPYRKL